ncbi:MAG TPA: NAD(P)-dependent oxidoreductase [Candidatus Saccharimonadales bacterium]|nr:NAD(P)-dependent oxidoreductase [Candidatus Saccharimonadales bacterium]
MKQVLILQDLGIPQEEFDNLASKSKIPLEFTKDSASNQENIEGIITIKAKVDEELLNKLPHLKFIAVAFTGYDCVDMTAAKKKNIVVMNVPSYATDCTAELAVGLAISLLREIPKGDKITRSDGWDLKPGLELSGKTVGIIGTGKIGIRVAELFKAFNCNIIGWSRSQNKVFKKIGGTYKQKIDDVFKEADIISIHLLLNETTKGIINSDLLSKMKKSAFLINVARGPIVSTADLANALTDGKIAGAGIDVYDQEPILPDNPLLKAPNTILTPHVAYKTEESLIRRAEVTLQNIHSFIKGDPANLVS